MDEEYKSKLDEFKYMTRGVLTVKLKEGIELQRGDCPSISIDEGEELGDIVDYLLDNDFENALDKRWASIIIWVKLNDIYGDDGLLLNTATKTITINKKLYTIFTYSYVYDGEYMYDGDITFIEGKYICKDVPEWN